VDGAVVLVGLLEDHLEFKIRQFGFEDYAFLIDFCEEEDLLNGVAVGRKFNFDDVELNKTIVTYY
jgi:hypothetical protein